MILWTSCCLRREGRFSWNTYSVKEKWIWITPDLSMKDFLLSEMVLDGHDELKISQLSLLLSSGRTSNETGLGEVTQIWSAGAGLIHLHIHTHAHTHTNTKTVGFSWGWCKSMQRLQGWGWRSAEMDLLGQGVYLEHTCCRHEYLLNQPPHT